MKQRTVKYHLFERALPIAAVLSKVASQENNDGPEYDLMVAAANYIRSLEDHVDFLEKKIKTIQEILDTPVLYF